MEWELALVLDRAFGETLPMLYRDYVAITIPLDYVNHY